MKAAHVRINAHAPLFIAEVNPSTDTLSFRPAASTVDTAMSPHPSGRTQNHGSSGCFRLRRKRCITCSPSGVILPTLQLSSVSSCCSVFGKDGCAAWKPVKSSIPPWPLYSPSSGVSSIVQGQSIVRVAALQAARCRQNRLRAFVHADKAAAQRLRGFHRRAAAAA